MDFIAQAMAYKQSKVDANRAMIQQNIDDIAGLDIAKPEAKEYLHKRIEQLLANVNQYGAVDLSSDGITRNIASYIDSAIDDTVINAYAGTMEGRRVEKYYNDLMLNDPDKYNERNKAFSLAPFYQWMQDGKAGSRLSPLQVSNYVDYRAEAEDVLKKVREAQKAGQEIQYPDPNNPGYMITEKIDQMTEDQVQQVAYNIMSEGAKKQMYIDGWYMSQTQPDLFTNESLNGYVGEFNKAIDRKRDALKAEMAGAVSDTRRYNELKAAYNTLVDKKDSFNTRAGQIFNSGDKAQMGAFIVENNFLTGLGKTWAYSNSVKKYEKNEAYWAEVNYNFKVQEAQEKAALEREKLNLAKEASARDNALAQAQIEHYNAKTIKELGGSNGGDKRSGNLSDIATRSNSIMDLSGKQMKATDYVASTMELATKKKMDNTIAMFNSLKDEDKKLVQGWIDEKKNSGGEYANLSQDEMIRRYFTENGNASNGMLSNGDARNNYMAIKEAELNESTAMGAIGKYMNFQKEVLSGAGDSETATFAALDLLRLISDHVNYDEYTKGLYFVLDKEKYSTVENNALVQSVIDVVGGDDVSYDAGNGDAYVRVLFDANPFAENYYKTSEEGLSALNIPQILKKAAGDASAGMLIGGTSGGALGSAFGGVGAGPGAIAGGAIGTTVGAGKGVVEGVYEQRMKMGSKLYAHLLKKNGGDKDAADAAFANVMKLTNKEEYEPIADTFVKTMKTPLGYIINNDAKIDSEKRKQFNKLTDLYIDHKRVPADNQGNIRNIIGNMGIVATAVLGENEGDIRYGLFINGSPDTFVEVSKNLLVENGIAVDKTNPIPSESIKHTEVNVFYPQKNDISYARTIARETGITAITSKADMFKSIVKNNGSMLQVPVTQEGETPKLTQIGSEIEELILKSDNFAVGIEGYKSDGIPGVKVFLYDRYEQEGARDPVYQYSIEVEEGNMAYKWLHLCPQYYVYRALNMMLNEYAAGVEDGTEAGKESINKALETVRKH